MSSTVILSVPVGGSPVPGEQWQGITQEWVAPDGRVWDLNAWESGLILDSRGVEGLHNPVITRTTSSSRLVPGHRRRGWRAEAREVFWPVFMYADAAADWLAVHRAFFDSIHPEQEGRWRVTCDGHTRELLLTGTFDQGHVYETDPVEDGWALYDVTLEAAQPFWAGEKVRRGPWDTPDPVSFFGGPAFEISSSANFGTASIPNEGDVPAWGIWWVTGPLVEVELGLGDTLIRVPFDIEDGQMLRIDTDPRNPTAQLGAAVDPDDTDDFIGEDATQQLGLQDYAVIPAKGTSELHVAGTGTGAVMFDLTPLYFRAF